MADRYTNPAHVVHDPGKNFTGRATTAIPGSRFVAFAAGGTATAPNLRLATAADASVVIGGSKYGCVANATTGVHARAAGQITVEAGAAITAPVGVVPDAEGRAIPATGGAAPVAVAYTDGALGDLVYVQFL